MLEDYVRPTSFVILVYLTSDADNACAAKPQGCAEVRDSPFKSHLLAPLPTSEVNSYRTNHLTNYSLSLTHICSI